MVRGISMVLPKASPYSAFWPSTVSMITSCATWSITFLRYSLLACIRRREGSCWLRDLHIFRRVRSGRAGLRRVSSLFSGRIGWAEGSIDWSVGWKSHPCKSESVTVSVSEFYLVLVSEFYLVSVSEFYLVSAPDILYGRLCDFYMILNCVGTQNSIMRLRGIRAFQ